MPESKTKEHYTILLHSSTNTSLPRFPGPHTGGGEGGGGWAVKHCFSWQGRWGWGGGGEGGGGGGGDGGGEGGGGWAGTGACKTLLFMAGTLGAVGVM